MLFLQLAEAGDEGFQLGLRGLDGRLLLREVASDDERLGDQVARPPLVLGLALLVRLQDAAGLRHPAIGGDEVGVVLHRLCPVVHQVLVDVVGIEQRRRLEDRKQVLGHRLDQRLRVVVLAERDEARRDGLAPLVEQRRHLLVEGGELRMAEDGGLDLGDGQLEAGVPGPARRLKQGGAHAGKNLPIGSEGIKIPLRNATAQVPVDVLQVFGLAAVDVARQVEVVVVLRVGDLGHRHHAGVARGVELPIEDVDDPVDVLLAQAVLVAVLDEALGGVDHEHALAGRRVLLVEHQDASWNARAIEQVGGQADDAFQDPRNRHELPANRCLGHRRETARRAAGCRLPCQCSSSRERCAADRRSRPAWWAARPRRSAGKGRPMA